MIIKYFKILTAGVACTLFFAGVYAQQSDRALLVAELQAMSKRYQLADHLSFDVLYRYADEQKPMEYLDSLAGNFKLNGTDSWCKMDNTEFISNAQHTIALFPEDNLMYVSRPAVGRMKLNPLQAIDSLLSATVGVKGSIDETATQKKITLVFPQGSLYKTAHFFINKQTGWLDKMAGFVQASQLYDPSVRSIVDNKDAYVIVETDFRNYQKGNFDSACFSSDHYFTKQGTEFIATASYSSYKIFIGSTDLQ